MTAMNIHQLIGTVLELAGLTLAIIAFAGVVITGYLYYTEGPGSVPDEVWDRYSKGGRWNYQHMGESGDSSAPRSYSDPRGRMSDIAGNYDPETWQAVEYDEDGDFGLVEDQEETRPIKSDMDLEIIETEIISNGDNRS